MKHKKNNNKNEKEKHNSNMNDTEIPVNDLPVTDLNDEVTAGETGETHGAGNENDKSEELGEKLAQLNDAYLRKVAEFENYKKRTDAEKTDFFAYANEKLIRDLLPVLDDFDRALTAYNDNHDADTLQKGLELISEKFKNILQKQGLKEIDSTGKEFDVHLHEAIMQQPSDAEPNTIIDTVEKGYRLKDKILRHSKVVVSAKPE
jgi:molecular chaperone GrpE